MTASEQNFATRASVGSLVTITFDPEGWREAYPYLPFFQRDAADDY